MNCLSLFEKDVNAVVEKITRKVVAELAAAYGFSEEEALQKLGAVQPSSEYDDKKIKKAALDQKP